MRSELEKRLRKHRAELDGLEKDGAEIDARKRTCKAIINELEGLLRVAPVGDVAALAERQLRVGTDPYKAREILRKARRPMHVKELLTKIGGEIGPNRRSSLASQLGSYAKKTEIFTKPGPNVFGLIDYGPEAISLEDEARYVQMMREEEVEANLVALGDSDIPF